MPYFTPKIMEDHSKLLTGSVPKGERAHHIHACKLLLRSISSGYLMKSFTLNAVEAGSISYLCYGIDDASLYDRVRSSALCVYADLE